MKNILFKAVVLGLSILMIAPACKKSFLDQDVPGKLSEQEFYKTDQDATQAVAAVYDIMQAHYNTAWTSMFVVKLMLGDESNAGGSGPGDQPGYQSLDKMAGLDSENGAVRAVWQLSYQTIYRANKVVANVTPDNALRKRLVAEAKVLRAYSYLDLVTLWGDVPLVLSDIAPTDYKNTTRTAKAAVYAQIDKDLTEAIVDLPLKSAYGAADKFRVSKGTAQSLLGRSLLYQGKWNESATQLEAVIVSNEYDLEPSVGIAMSDKAEFGKESVFETSFTKGQAYDWGNFPWGAQPESNIHIQLMGPRSDYYVKAPADSLLGGWGFSPPTAKMWNAFIAAGDVNRRRSTIMSEAELKAAGGNWTDPTAYEYAGYFQRKYGSYSTQAGGPITELNYGTNYRLVRFADVLLMAAEAYNKANNDAKARPYLNRVRTRSGLTGVGTSGTALFEDIVKERQLELAFEGFRYIDLVRWGRAATELAASGYSAKNALLPIPATDVRTAGLTQNSGY